MYLEYRPQNAVHFVATLSECVTYNPYRALIIQNPNYHKG